MLIQMQLTFKKDHDAITASPSLDPDSCNPFNETNYFSVCNYIVLPISMPNMVLLQQVCIQAAEDQHCFDSQHRPVPKIILQKKCQNTF